MVDEQLWRDVKRAVPRHRPPYLPKAVGEVEGFTVVLVDGNKVKTRQRRGGRNKKGDDSFISFVEGGNGLEDDELCAQDEVYLDALLQPECWPFVCYHEVHEARDMRDKGMSYAKAHDRANAGEEILRQREGPGDAA